MIRARQVRVVDENGEQLGIMDPRDALREAEGKELDLVEVAPNANPPVCRIMDYGKYKYEQKRRERESRKHQHTVSVKEIKFRPKIDQHDFEFKANHVREFLSEGNKVKVTIMFRGREMAHPEFGRDILQKVVDYVQDLLTGEYAPQSSRLEGRNMSIVLQPDKQQVAKIKEAKESADEQKAAKESVNDQKAAKESVDDQKTATESADEQKAAKE